MKTEWVVERIESTVRRRRLRRQPPTIILLGLAFKPNIDDMRESPAVEVAYKLLEKELQIAAIEPNISTHPVIELVSLEQFEPDGCMVVSLVAMTSLRMRTF